MPRHITPTAAELEAIEDLRAELGRDPGRVALAERLGCTRTRAEHLARWLGEARKFTQGEQPRGTDGSGPPKPPELSEPRDPRTAKGPHVNVTDTDPDPGYDYEHRPGSDEYVFAFPGRPGALVLPGWRVEAMLDAYTSWDGNSHTMDEVARAHNLTRAEFYGVKRAMGWTKTALPLLVEQWGALSEDEAADALLAKKQRGAEVKASRRRWRETERDAERWRRFESEKLRPLAAMVEKLGRTYEAPRGVRSAPIPEGRPCAAIWAPTDHHVGKPGALFESGILEHGFAEAEARLLSGTAAFVATLPAGCERIIAVIGNDYFTGDNERGDTTAGTRQEMAGTGMEMMHRGSALKLRAMELLVQTGLPVDVLVVPGNHDRMLSELVGGLVWAYFRHVPSVHVHSALRSLLEGEQITQGSRLRVLTYGRTLLAAVHGDGISRPQDLAITLAHLFPAEWGRTTTRIVLHGHYHTAKLGPLAIRVDQDDEIREEHGLLRFSMPSLSLMDAWHFGKGYCTNKPALLAPTLDREHGWTGTRRWTVGMLRAA